DRIVVACGAPSLQLLDLAALRGLWHSENGIRGTRQGRGLAFKVLVDADHSLLAALDRFQPRRIRLDELLLHVARIDGGNSAAHLLDALEFLLGLALQVIDFVRNLVGAVENVAVVKQVGLVSENLLHAQRPLLVPRSWQAK